MQRPRSSIPLALLALAAVAAAVALFFGRGAPGPGSEDADLDKAVVLPQTKAVIPEEWKHLPVGGVYAGMVLDAKDRPVPDATVLLVSVGASMEVLEREGEKPVVVPKFGMHGTAAEVKTDQQGRFSAAAGDQSVVAIVAYHRSHAPGILTGAEGKPLAPGNGLNVRLPAPGMLKGKVIDKVTKEAVSGAEVWIFVQQQANKPFTATNAFAEYQDWVQGVLAPRLWAIEPPVEEHAGLHVRTRTDGTFEFGPISGEVQLEFWIDHPEYAWTDQDPEQQLEEDNPGLKEGEKGLTRIKRMVIQGGETVSRTFELVKGKEISGVLVDENKRGIPDAKVFVEHIAQYHQYHPYRNYPRVAVTDRDGRFRVPGLDRGPYSLHFRHPAFNTWYPPASVPEGTRDMEFQVMSAGWIEGTMTGGPSGQAWFAATIYLDPVSQGLEARQTKVSVKDGKFKVEQVTPGTWLLHAQQENLISTPQTVVVESLKESDVAIALSSGGTIYVRLVDADGRIVDPATLQLEVLSAGEGLKGRRAGMLMSRQGVVDNESILPGRYRAHAHSMGFMEASTEPFEVVEGKTTRLDPITLHRWGYLALQGVEYADRTSPASDPVISTEWSVNGGPWSTGLTNNLGQLKVGPGRVTVRVTTQGGRKFEEAFEVGDGVTVPFRIVLK